VEAPEEVECAEGRLRVSGLRLRDGSHRVKIDALLFDGVETPAFELCVQAGGRTHFDPALGYVPEVDAHGQVAPKAFCAGRVTGAGLSSAQQGADVGQRIAAELLAR
jgi:hypothetical protein